jgi:uncharacterized protein (DUF58 family)
LILAMMLSAMAISGVLSEHTMRRLRLRRELPRRLFAGTPEMFGVHLANRKRRLPSYALHVTEPDPSGGPAATRFFLRIAPREEERWLYALSFPRRGRHELPGLRLSTRFPFGLFAKISRPILADPVLVYPAVRPLAAKEIPAALDAGWRERHRRGGGTGLYNLRPYRPGDDMRLVHWKTSARLGDLILKELEEEDRLRIRLAIEDPAPGTLPEKIEADLSYLASLGAFAIRCGAMVELVTAEGSSGFGVGDAHLDRMLEWLALYVVPSAPRPLRAGSAVEREVRVRLGASRNAEEAG